MICSKRDEKSCEICVSLLKSEKILILPTDTVYGFSGIVGKTDEKIRAIKGREENKPFIQLIANPSDIFSITDDKIPSSLLNIWPGPLTIIVNDKNNPDTTVAVRCPGDEWLRKVIAKTEKPIYSTSVNRSGNPVLTKINEIKAEFENEVDLIVDAGDCVSCAPSTIVKIDGEKVVVLREGAIKITE